MTKRQHHPRSLDRAEKIDGAPPCFSCGLKAAGNDYAGPFSAYCESCQPRAGHPVHGGANQCAACLAQTGRLTDFDRAQEHYPQGHPEWGCFTGECIDPATLTDPTLTQDEHRVWQTRAGLVKRARTSALLHDLRERAEE